VHVVTRAIPARRADGSCRVAAHRARADGRPCIVALNKVDRLDADVALEALVDRFDGVAISARTGEASTGSSTASRRPGPRVERVTLRIRTGRHRARHCYGRAVLARSDDADGIRLESSWPHASWDPWKPIASRREWLHESDAGVIESSLVRSG